MVSSVNLSNELEEIVNESRANLRNFIALLRSRYESSTELGADKTKI